MALTNIPENCGLGTIDEVVTRLRGLFGYACFERFTPNHGRLFRVSGGGVPEGDKRVILLGERWGEDGETWITEKQMEAVKRKEMTWEELMSIAEARQMVRYSSFS